MVPESIHYSISLIFCGAALLATVALYFRNPLPVVYIVLGALAGPGGLGFLGDVELIEEIAHIGVVFLLFLLGLDLYPQKLMLMFKNAFVVTAASFITFSALAVAVTLSFGFDMIDAIIAGAACGFSSTIIGLKLLPTTVLHHRHIGELVIGVLLLQDVLAIIALIAVQSMQGAQEFMIGHLFPLVSLPALTGLAFLLEYLVIRRLILRFERIREYIFLLTIGWCLGFAELAHFMHLHQGIGAFIAGVAMAASPIARYVAERLHPLRDFFMVMFFVAIGAHVNLDSIADVLLPAAVLAALMIVAKPVAFRFLLKSVGERNDASWEVGFRLGQLSEFSLLLVFVAVSAGIIGERTENFLLLATIFTFILSSYLVVFRYPTPVAVSDRLRQE